ncbi:MAG TPA: polysaccharide deacetylase family protein [Marmoricola sp.]|nr:polysaccharide deacetylase family protein [Marmoricola sp.]
MAVRVALASAVVMVAGAMGAPVAAHEGPSLVLSAARTGTASDARPAPALATSTRPCTKGLVALTFDDGPARGLTAKLVRILRDRHVPATFFMVGSRVHTAPRAARLVARDGFTIGNHTWSHAHLTRLTDRGVRTEIRRTARELRHNGIHPSTLMRPPYGDVDDRVRNDVRALGLVPVLWTVDSNDWRGGSTRQIADSILGQLRPHRTNVVLQHDGVTNSPASVAAVPRVVKVARHRGYCFAALGPHGHPRLPVAATVAAPAEAEVEPTVQDPVVFGSPVDVVIARADGA